jgi:hypothetical protein
MGEWKRWLVLGFAVVGSFGISSTPRAETINQTITKWGLLGTWAVDCKAPADRDHTRATYAIRAGKPVHLRNWGDGKDDSPILAATIAPDQSIELRINFISIKQIRDFALLRGSDQRIRAKYSRAPDGTYAIFDGKTVPDGDETRWQARCN